MPIELDTLVSSLKPSETVLFFGAGSSIPSGAPTVARLMDSIRKKFSIENAEMSLSELAFLAEIKSNRQELISCLRENFKGLKVTGGLSTLPIHPWKAIYTTNYDRLIEDSYKDQSRDLNIYTNDFEFSQQSTLFTTKLYKIHGSIQHDISDGHLSRLIITDQDYDKVSHFRENVYAKLASDLTDSHLVIIGYSLRDPAIKEVIDRALSIQSRSQGSGGKISLVMYEEDLDRASLFEARNISVSFGCVDKFFSRLANFNREVEVDTEVCASPMEQFPRLRAITVDVRHASESFDPEFAKMYNGSPATYADIRAGYTFGRTISERMGSSLRGGQQALVLLGASGVGKTTAIRQMMLQFDLEGWHIWEHRPEFELIVSDWLEVARSLEALEESAVLFIDDAHMHLPAICDLADGLSVSGILSLKIVCASSKHQWSPRYKSPYLNKMNVELSLSQLDSSEIEGLIHLVDTSDDIRPLIEHVFVGYSTQEKRRRLAERCDADMFVCMKNIFATEKFDDIILREYASIEPKYADVYRIVAAMENSGIRVHRQLIIRYLRIPADQVFDILQNLEDIVIEYDVFRRESIFGWRVRHSVIAAIIAKYKYPHESQIIDLFDRVIDCISPSHDIELRTIREMCNISSGIPVISDKNVQNRLLRRIISIAPGERVPRHRLIRNLIELTHFDQAETELRLFRKDIGLDGPLARYEIELALARAREAPGLLADDRLTILGEARTLAERHLSRYDQNRTVHYANCEVATEWFRLTGDYSYFDQAIGKFKSAEAKFSDPEMTRSIRNLERKIGGVTPVE